MFKRIPSSPLCWEEMSDVIYGYAYLFSKPFPTRGVKSHTSRTSRVYGLVFLWGAHIRPFPVLRSAFGPLCQCWDPDATEPGGERLANSQLEKSCLVTNFLSKKKQTNKSFFGLFFSLLSSNKELPPPSTALLLPSSRVWEACTSTTAAAACPRRRLRAKTRRGPCGRSASGWSEKGWAASPAKRALREAPHTHPPRVCAPLPTRCPGALSCPSDSSTGGEGMRVFTKVGKMRSTNGKRG